MLEIKDIMDSVKHLLDKNNTTTSDYDISDGLNERVKQIIWGVEGLSERYPVPNNMYPTIFVELNTKSDEFEQLGRSSRRDAELNVAVKAVSMYGYGTGEAAKADEESVVLAQNIEDLVRNSIRISNTVDTVLLNSTNFGESQNPETYNIISNLNLMIKKRTT